MSPPVDKNVELLRKHVDEYPDFPKPGVLFRDIFSIFRKPSVAAILRDVLLARAKNINPPVDCIVALDARGFLLGPLIALDLKIPFVPVRKKGKLPGKTEAVSYDLEYGQDTLEIQSGGIQKDQRVLIVDDLLATGGSLEAACKLVEKLNGTVSVCLVVMELKELKGRCKVPANIISILEY